MKKLLFSALGFLFFVQGFAQVSDKLFTVANINKIKIDGYIGSKMDACIQNGILATDENYLVEPFRHRNEKSQWQSEFWGKWFTAAADAYQYTRDAKLLAKLQNAVNGLLSTQTPDGYIGNYAPEYRLQQWDIWGMKYCLLGLLDYYEITKDARTLNAMKKLADYVMKATAEKNIPYHQFGNYKGMAASSILEPIVKLYNITRQKSYLQFAQKIVASWSDPGASDLIGNALKNIAVGKRSPIPAIWYGPDNGQKAYEMMSCYEGLLELYRITGNKQYLQAVQMAAENILKTEIYITGSGASMECWFGGAHTQSTPVKHTMEACVTVTWMKFCLQLLRITGDAKWANEIEKSYYNALLGTMTPDGATWSKYIGIKGKRYMGEEQCGMTTNCCIANGPRGIMLAPKEAVMTGNNEIAINFYTPLTATVDLNKNQKINIKVITSYPKDGNIDINIAPKKAGTFNLKLRIPDWAENYTIEVNGQKQNYSVANGYAAVKRLWKAGDIVNVNFHYGLRQFKLDGDAYHYALLYGPLVLASDKRYQELPFYEFYTPVLKDGKIPFTISVQNKIKDVYLEMKVPFIKEVNGLVDVEEYITLVDFASSGNTWTEASANQVWMQKIRDVSKEK